MVDGVATALAALYDRYGRRAYSLARRICVDDGLAEDVVQEAFLAFWRDPRRYDPDRGRFGTWILTLVHHKSVDAVRRESAIRRRTVPAAEEGEDWSAPPGPGADHGALRAVEAGHVRDALGGLPPTSARRSRSPTSAATPNGRSPRPSPACRSGTVKSRMFSGMQRLRGVLGPVIGEVSTDLAWGCPVNGRAGAGEQPLCPMEDQAVAFALHALEPDEELAMRTHLLGCRSCRDTVRETEVVAAALASSVEQADPPPRLRDNILATAAATPQLHPGRHPSPPPNLIAIPPVPVPVRVAEPPRVLDARRRAPSRRRLALVAAAAVVAIGVGGLATYTVQVQQQRDALAHQAQALAGIVTQLDQPGTATPPSAPGRASPSRPCSSARPGAPSSRTGSRPTTTAARSTSCGGSAPVTRARSASSTSPHPARSCTRCRGGRPVLLRLRRVARTRPHDARRPDRRGGERAGTGLNRVRTARRPGTNATA